MGSAHSNANELSRIPCHETCNYCQKLNPTEIIVNIVRMCEDILPTHRSGDLHLLQSLCMQELQENQAMDTDISPVVTLFKEDKGQPSKETVAPYSPTTKAYCSQWDSRCLHDGVLYRRRESPTGSGVAKGGQARAYARHSCLMPR